MTSSDWLWPMQLPLQKDADKQIGYQVCTCGCAHVGVHMCVCTCGCALVGQHMWVCTCGPAHVICLVKSGRLYAAAAAEAHNTRLQSIFLARQSAHSVACLPRCTEPQACNA